MRAENEGSELHKQFEVLVCTGASLLRGTLRCDFSQRLIDALNEGMRTETSAKVIGFLPLLNVTMTGDRGGRQKFQRIYVAKNNIVWVAQMSDDSVEKPARTYPFREKVPVAVRVIAARVSDARHTIDGRMYVDTGGQLIDTIESEARFIPMTHVEIKPALPGADSRHDFIALNKDHIISISESAAQ